MADNESDSDDTEELYQLDERHTGKTLFPYRNYQHGLTTPLEDNQTLTQRYTSEDVVAQKNYSDRLTSALQFGPTGEPSKKGRDVGFVNTNYYGYDDEPRVGETGETSKKGIRDIAFNDVNSYDDTSGHWTGSPPTNCSDIVKPPKNRDDDHSPPSSPPGSGGLFYSTSKRQVYSSQRTSQRDSGHRSGSYGGGRTKRRKCDPELSAPVEQVESSKTDLICSTAVATDGDYESLKAAKQVPNAITTGKSLDGEAGQASSTTNKSIAGFDNLTLMLI